MITKIKLENKTITVDLSKPLDLSITLSGDENNPIAWYLEQPTIEPVQEGKWIAKVSEGSSVNFNNLQFNPHAHGTHTECVGHISEDFYSVNKALKQFFFTAKVISLVPENYGEDAAISKKQLQHYLTKNEAEAYANDVIPRARGEAAKILQAAEAYKKEVVAKAEGEASRFLSIYAEYAKAKEVTQERMYLETMEQVLADINKIIIDKDSGSGVVPYLPLQELKSGTN